MIVIRGTNFLALSTALALICLTVFYRFDNGPPYVLGFLSLESNAYMAILTDSLVDTLVLRWNIVLIPVVISMIPALWTHNFLYFFWGVIYSIPWGFILTIDHLIMS